MNTILITGTAKMNSSNNVEYDIHLWGAKEGEQLQFIRPIEKVLAGYNELWELAKSNAIYYFNCTKLGDGAYTQYLDHLIMIK